MMPTWQGQMGPPGVPPATNPMPAPPSQLQPQAPTGPPPFAPGNQQPSPEPARPFLQPGFDGMVDELDGNMTGPEMPPNLPTFAPNPGSLDRQNMQPQSFGFTNLAEVDEEPQPCGMPMPSMQAPPTTTAFGLPVPLPTPADEVATDIDSYATPFPPPETASFPGELCPPAGHSIATPLQQAFPKASITIAEHMPDGHNYTLEPHDARSAESVPLSGLAPPPGLEPLAEPLAEPPTGNLQAGVEAALAGNVICEAATADGVGANITLDNAAARGIVSNGNDALDDEAGYARDPPAAADLENSRPTMNGGLGAAAGFAMDDPAAEPSPTAEEEELVQEENRVPPAHLVRNTLQLGDEDLTQLLRLSLEERPWLRKPVTEALSSLKPSRGARPLAPMSQEPFLVEC